MGTEISFQTWAGLYHIVWRNISEDDDILFMALKTSDLTTES